LSPDIGQNGKSGKVFFTFLISWLLKEAEKKDT
jgi:hypothetical protein